MFAVALLRHIIKTSRQLRMNELEDRQLRKTLVVIMILDSGNFFSSSCAALYDCYISYLFRLLLNF